MHQDYMVRVPGGTLRMGNTPAMHLTLRRPSGVFGPSQVHTAAILGVRLGVNF